MTRSSKDASQPSPYQLDDAIARAEKVGSHVLELVDLLTEIGKPPHVIGHFASSAEKLLAGLKSATNAKDSQDFVKHIQTASFGNQMMKMWLNLLVKSGAITEEEIGDLLAEIDGLKTVLKGILRQSRTDAQ